MKTVYELPEFRTWFRAIRDVTSQRRLLRRIRRISLGNFGDVHWLGGGLGELREHFGPGWRIYFQQICRDSIVLLLGGTKSTQDEDISAAKALAKTLDRRGSRS